MIVISFHLSPPSSPYKRKPPTFLVGVFFPLLAFCVFHKHNPLILFILTKFVDIFAFRQYAYCKYYQLRYNVYTKSLIRRFWQRFNRVFSILLH